jgi:hypothetical protein
MCRANHYEVAGAVHLLQQNLEADYGERVATQCRRDRMGELLQKHYGKINRAAAQAILTDREGAWPYINRYPSGEAGQDTWLMSLDSFFTISEDRVFYTCRGGRQLGPWQEFSL